MGKGSSSVVVVDHHWVVEWLWQANGGL